MGLSDFMQFDGFHIVNYSLRRNYLGF